MFKLSTRVFKRRQDMIDQFAQFRLKCDLGKIVK